MNIIEMLEDGDQNDPKKIVKLIFYQTINK